MNEVRPGSTRTSYPGRTGTSRRWDLKQKVLLITPQPCPLRLPVPIHQPLHVSADARQGAGGFVLWVEADQDSCYHLRTKPAARAQRFTIAPKAPSLRSQKRRRTFCAVCSA
jgi:hypothetical protein